MSSINEKFDSIENIDNQRTPHYYSFSNNYTVLDLLFMWKKLPAVNLSFIINRSMGLLGYRREATLFYFALAGALDYNYVLAMEKIMHVASQFGQYIHTFWYDITHE